jgi:hypothetical protein
MDDSIQMVLDQESPKVRQELAKAMEKQNAGTRSGAERFATLQETIRQVQEEFRRIAAPSLEAFPKIDFEGLEKRLISDGIKLAECGWTTPDWLTPREYHSLAQLNTQELDEAFQEIYFSGNRPKLKLIRSRLQTDPATDKWRNLIHQLFDCLDRNEHVIAIPALFVLLEALIAEFLAMGNVNRIRENNPAKIFQDAHKQSGTVVGSVLAMIALSTRKFLELLYANSPFDRQPPSLINRHWVMHGRDASNWSVADALRLVNAVGTLHWLFGMYRQ